MYVCVCVLRSSLFFFFFLLVFDTFFSIKPFFFLSLFVFFFRPGSPCFPFFSTLFLFVFFFQLVKGPRLQKRLVGCLDVSSSFSFPTFFGKKSKEGSKNRKKSAFLVSFFLKSFWKNDKCPRALFVPFVLFVVSFGVATSQLSKCFAKTFLLLFFIPSKNEFTHS